MSGKRQPTAPSPSRGRAHLAVLGLATAALLVGPTPSVEAQQATLFVDDFEQPWWSAGHWKSECEDAPLPAVAKVQRGRCGIRSETLARPFPLPPTQNRFMRFAWAPWMYRSAKDLGKKRGGAEIKGEVGAANYATEGRMLWYRWRFRVQTMAALLPVATTGQRFARTAWIGQWHHRTSCTPSDAGRSPVVGLALTTDGSNAVIHLKSKQPRLPYYEHGDGAPGANRGVSCTGTICTVTLASLSVPRAAFVGRWHEVILGVRWAQATLATGASSTTAPSTGVVVASIDGVPLVGPANHRLPWVRNQSVFSGLTTMPNSCRNYLKLGAYVNRYHAALDPRQLYHGGLGIDAQSRRLCHNIGGQCHEVTTYSYGHHTLVIDYDDIRVQRQPDDVLVEPDAPPGDTAAIAPSQRAMRGGG